jgi:hypothetical protein
MLLFRLMFRLKYHHLKVDSAKIALAMNQKKVGEDTPYYLSLSSLLISLSYYLFLGLKR